MGVGSAASSPATKDFPLDRHGGPRSAGPEESPVHGTLTGRLEWQVSVLLTRLYPGGYVGQLVLQLLSIDRVLA